MVPMLPTPRLRYNSISPLKPAAHHRFTREQDLIMLGLNLYCVYNNRRFVAFRGAVERRVSVSPSKIRHPREGLQQLESITWQGRSVCCVPVWPSWQLLGPMEEKDCKVADFFNCLQIFKPPLLRFTQTFTKSFSNKA